MGWSGLGKGHSRCSGVFRGGGGPRTPPPIDQDSFRISSYAVQVAVLQKRNASINKRYRNARKKFKEAHKNNVRNRMNSSDYILENYIAVDSKFPPTLWAKSPDLLFPQAYTNNGAESYHSHLNAEFYVKHPNFYVFVDVLKKIQQYVTTGTEVQIREKTAFVVSAYTTIIADSVYITRKEFLKKVFYRYGPRTEL